jgi:AP-1 complex subunit sigma 1/2
MMIEYLLLINRQGKTRLSRWYASHSLPERHALARELANIVTCRPPRLPTILDVQGGRVVFRRYASLYFIVGIDGSESELLVLEMIHRFVEIMDSYFRNVCELDMIFNYARAFAIWDEMVVGGRLVETSPKVVLQAMHASDDRIKRESEEGRTKLFS